PEHPRAFTCLAVSVTGLPGLLQNRVLKGRQGKAQKNRVLSLNEETLKGLRKWREMKNLHPPGARQPWILPEGGRAGARIPESRSLCLTHRRIYRQLLSAGRNGRRPPCRTGSCTTCHAAWSRSHAGHEPISSVP